MDELFYTSRRKTVLRNIRSTNQRQMGTTKDGDPVWHTTYFNPETNRHISYDTVFYKDGHCYILGSGHEVDDKTNEVVVRWDPGKRITWVEALERHTKDLLHDHDLL